MSLVGYPGCSHPGAGRSQPSGRRRHACMMLDCVDAATRYASRVAFALSTNHGTRRARSK